MSRTRKNKLTRNYDIDEETTLSGEKGLLIADEGMDFDKILENKVLVDKFSIGGLYVISVKIDAYKQYIKVGMSNSNMINRISSHRTTLFPVHEYIKVHCLAIKPNNRLPEEQDEKKLKSTFVKKAETHILEYLETLKNQPPAHGEWHKIAVPRLIEIMLNFHFGNEDLNIRADGYKCKFYVFSSKKCFSIDKTDWNPIQPEDKRMASRNNGKDYKHVSLP